MCCRVKLRASKRMRGYFARGYFFNSVNGAWKGFLVRVSFKNHVLTNTCSYHLILKPCGTGDASGDASGDAPGDASTAASASASASAAASGDGSGDASGSSLHTLPPSTACRTASSPRRSRCSRKA